MGIRRVGSRREAASRRPSLASSLVLIIAASLSSIATGADDPSRADAVPAGAVRQALEAPREEAIRPDESLPPEAARSFLVDKSRIARETAARLRSLQELGNPHIGRGWLLSRLERDSEAASVDLLDLREERIAMFRGEAREGLPVEVAAGRELRRQEAERATTARRGARAAPSGPLGGNGWVVLSILLASGFVFALFRFTR